MLDRKEPLSLYDPMRYTMEGGGKRFRPVLMLLCCEAAGGKSTDALDAAVALELVHNFTLVHDDIMDDDELRRGRETVYKRWDQNVAILSGDGLLALAYSTLSRIHTNSLHKVIKSFSEGTIEVCEGQALDKEFEERDIINLNEYFSMIGKKTGRLFSIASEIGGFLGGGSDIQISALYEYGAVIGRAFQVQDDLLDLLSDETTLGKDIGSDLEKRKKTYLMTHAFEYGGPTQIAQLENILNNRPLTSDHLRQVVDLFTEIGTIAAANKEVDKCLDRARKALTVINETESKQYLMQLVDKIGRRNF